MFDSSVRRETIHMRTFALCMSVWCRVGLRVVCIFKKRGKEMKFNSEWIMEHVVFIMEYISAVCCSDYSSRVNGMDVRDVLKQKQRNLRRVLGIVSGTVWIACGCLAGLIPLKSTISLHSLSTKACPPAKVHLHCFYHHFFKRKQNCAE